MSKKKTGRALLVVDVQVDFCEGGALAVAGGNRVAEGIAKKIRGINTRLSTPYDVLIASQDWHAEPPDDNGGHFALGDAEPDFITSWPIHCVAGWQGARLHPALTEMWFDYIVRKGHGSPAYSAFAGTSAEGPMHRMSGALLPQILSAEGISALDICGIATDHCVRASAVDALRAGFRVRILRTLTAGVDPSASRAALDDLVRLGATISPALKETNR